MSREQPTAARRNFLASFSGNNMLLLSNRGHTDTIYERDDLKVCDCERAPPIATTSDVADYAQSFSRRILRRANDGGRRRGNRAARRRQHRAAHSQLSAFGQRENRRAARGGRDVARARCCRVDGGRAARRLRTRFVNRPAASPLSATLRFQIGRRRRLRAAGAARALRASDAQAVRRPLQHRSKIAEAEIKNSAAISNVHLSFKVFCS